MNKLFKIITMSALVTLLVACGEPTLDTSSESAMQASVIEILDELSPEDQERFGDAITGMYMLAGLASLGTGESPDVLQDRLSEELHGKTAKEVFAMAEEMAEELN